MLNVRFFYTTEEVGHNCPGDNFSDYEKKYTHEGQFRMERFIYACISRDIEGNSLFRWASEDS